MYFSLPVCAQYLGPWGKSYLRFEFTVQLRFAEFGPKLVLCEIVVFGSITTNRIRPENIFFTGLHGVSNLPLHHRNY